MRPSDTDLAWLAGIIDGEGTIGIHRTNAKCDRHPYLRPHIQVVNTNVDLLDKARSIFSRLTHRDHNLVLSNKHGEGKNWKPGYRIAANTQLDAVAILSAIMPYLVAKRAQAEQVLDFALRRRARLTKRWYEFREQDQSNYETCLKLNRRGVSPEDAVH